MLSGFKSDRLEAPVELARYRMAVATIVGGGSVGHLSTTRKILLKVKAVHVTVANQEGEEGMDKPTDKKSLSDKAAARIDVSHSPV